MENQVNPNAVTLQVPPRKKKYNEPPKVFWEAYTEIMQKHDQIKSMILLMKEGGSAFTENPSAYWNIMKTFELLSDDLEKSLRSLLWRTGYDVVAN